MRRLVAVMLGAAILVLAVGPAGAALPEEKCLAARARAKAKFLACVDGWLAKVYGKPSALYPEQYAKAMGKLAKCRIKYDLAWTKLQAKQTGMGTTCDQVRFVSNSDGTISDNLTGLVWEKKGDAVDAHDKDYLPTWSTGGSYGDGTAFTTFLTTDLNTPSFAGASDWRLPTFAELQTILLPQPYPCTTDPCVPAVFDTNCTVGCSITTCSCTYGGFHWTSTTRADLPLAAWYVDFSNGGAESAGKISTLNVRAVRAGL